MFVASNDWRNNSAMKRLFLVLITIILAISLCSCGKLNTNIPSIIQQGVQDELIELDTSRLGNIILLSADSNDKYSVMLYTDFTEEYVENEDEYTEEGHYYLSLFDVQKNAEIKRTELENKDSVGYDVEINDEGISLYNMSNNERIIYNYNLENPVKSTYEFEDYYETAKKIDTIDADRFNCCKDYALSYDYGKNQALLFYDQADKLYMMKGNIYYEYICASNHNMLVIDNKANKTEKPESVESIVRIFDFDNQREINNITIPNNLDFNNIQNAKFNDKCATIATVNENGIFDKIYVWNYNINAKNNSFENGFCEVVGIDEIQLKIDDTCKRIKESCGVTVICSPEFEFIKQEFAINNNIGLVEFYKSLLDLEYYLSIFPKEVYVEIICNDIENPVAQFDDFRIYLVGDFPNDNIDAFANNIGCDETDNQDIVYIVYSCYGLNQKTFFHELMHAFEYRIWNYEEDFDEKWLELNPKSFDYSDDYSSLFYDESHSEWQDYFARDYGMKNILEDRATCFEELCDGVLTDSCWWKEKPGILAKQQYLAQTLKKSFACLNNSKILTLY